MPGFGWTFVAALLLTACQTAAGLPPTATTLRVIQATQVPTALRAIPSLEPSALPTLVDCKSTAALPTTQHVVDAEVSYANHRAAVHQQVSTINRGSEPLTQVVFDVEANRFPGIFTLDDVTTDHGAQVYELTGRRLTIDLVDSFAPGCTLVIDLDFRLNVPAIGEENGYLGYSQNQLNLGHWLPMLAVRRGGEWITHEVSAIGEQTANDIADWDVTLTVSDAPTGLIVAAPGTFVGQDGYQWRYTYAGAREFTLSMSPRFQVDLQTAENGVRVELYTFGERTASNGVSDNVQQTLTAAAQAISMYSDLFGDYPNARFLVVQGDFPDGMEFSGIVFVSEAWFRTNPGGAQSYLTLITVHETSHQWWYARVGNDQALDPWLDEALACYSEYIFYEEHYPDLKQWWWDFRVGTFVKPDYSGRRVDSTVYEFSTGREYIDAVYLRGAQMLDALRQDVGTEVFFDWLRRYAEVGRNRIVAPDEFWSLLTADQLEQTRATRAKYTDSVQP